MAKSFNVEGMSFFKYHLVFIMSTLLLMCAINYDLGGDWGFKLLLLGWPLTSGIAIVCMTYITDSFFKRYKKLPLLILMYFITYLIFIFLLAGIFAGKASFISGLVIMYREFQMVRMVTIPILLSFGIVVLYYRGIEQYRNPGKLQA